MSALTLIVGLGNPGDEYARTRHNAGVWLIEALAQHYGVALNFQSKFSGYTARIQRDSLDAILLVPTTYMNRSGIAVQAVAHFYQIAPQNILVAHDELDLAAGVIRFKKGGGHGGHNGLRDIIAHIGADFARCRMGIGHPGIREEVTNFVLHAPSQADRKALDQSIEQVLEYAPELLSLQLQKLMNHCNRKAKGES